ncbi:hypothetical protein V8D89_000666 [Ganoderma adspersum]
MRYSTAILAALLGLLQVSASPINVARQDTDSGGPESTFTPGPFPSGSFSFPSGSFSFPSGSFSFPSGSFSLPSGFPSSISIPPFPSDIAFPTPIQSRRGGIPGTCPSGSGPDKSFPVPSDKSFPFASDKPFGAFPSGESVPAFPFPGGSAYTAGSVPTANGAPGAFSYSFPAGAPYSFPTGAPSGIPNPSEVVPTGTGKGGEQHPPSFLTSATGLV